jgi:hypothetical protein
VPVWHELFLVVRLLLVSLSKLVNVRSLVVWVIEKLLFHGQSLLQKGAKLYLFQLLNHVLRHKPVLRRNLLPVLAVQVVVAVLRVRLLALCRVLVRDNVLLVL